MESMYSRQRLPCSWPALLAAIVALVTIAPSAADEEAEWDVNPSAVEFTKMSIPLMGVTLGTMLAMGDREDSDAARYCLDAMLTTELAVEVIKRVTKQPRPHRPATEDGFPSGHAAVAFAFARSLADWRPDAGPVLYAFAGTAAWARVQEGAHTWPQVLCGAALGAWIADRSLDAGGGIWFGAITPAQDSASARFAVSHQPCQGGYTIWETTW